MISRIQFLTAVGEGRREEEGGRREERGGRGRGGRREEDGPVFLLAVSSMSFLARGHMHLLSLFLLINFKKPCVQVLSSLETL